MINDSEIAGYALIPGPGERGWVPVTRFANRLLRNNARVLVVTESASMPAGTFVVPVTQAFDPDAAFAPVPTEIVEIAREAEIEVRPLRRDESFIARPLSLVRIGLYGGGGAPFNHAGILSACGFRSNSSPMPTSAPASWLRSMSS